jgi:hypothetical protein
MAKLIECTGNFQVICEDEDYQVDCHIVRELHDRQSEHAKMRKLLEEYHEGTIFYDCEADCGECMKCKIATLFTDLGYAT